MIKAYRTALLAIPGLELSAPDIAEKKILGFIVPLLFIVSSCNIIVYRIGMSFIFMDFINV